MQKGKKTFLTKQESELAQKQAYIRWQTRKDQKSIGKPICAIGEYEKIFRITMSLDESDLLLVSLEKSLEPFKIVKEIRNVIDSMPFTRSIS